MTAAVTTVQNELKALLDAIPLSSRPVPYGVRIADMDVQQIQSQKGEADVIIGSVVPSAIAYTSSSILERHLVPVTVRQLYTANDQTDEIGDNNSLTQLVRDTVSNYHTAASRVDDLVAVHPFETGQSLSSGSYISKFVLDIDHLRRVTPITQDETTPDQLLSDIRTAFWDSFNNWSEWDGSTWTRKFEDDEDIDELAMHDPGRFDLPALAVTWGPTSPEFFTHQTQNWPAIVNVVAWFPAHQTRLAEYRANQIVRAIYQCGPDGDPTNRSYVKIAAGRLPEKDSPIRIEPVELGRSGQLKAIRLTCSFVIKGVVVPMYD